jgi:hypothetical protein
LRFKYYFVFVRRSNKDDVIIEETHSDSSSYKSASDSEDSDTSDDDKNSDPPSQPCGRPNLRNLKWASKLGTHWKMWI